ncbi:MAG: carboxypeptidase-like regulatory domain-containing protein [Methanophagales archaeon]|nr:carboxypeptidase-like regulatory domain-containing protein [Methanophagales archaeon]
MRYKRLLFVLLYASLVTVIAMAGCIQPEITISGTVTNYSSGEPLKGIEVAVYTYQQPPLEYLPPLGEKIANASSDEQGRYVLRVPANYKNKKVVVFCHDVAEGWEVINITEPIKGIDLVFGAPAPIGVPTEKLSISTNKVEYAEGEIVTFWIENICNETVNLMNGAPWKIQKKTNGVWKNVFVPMSIQVILPIAPGENMSWSWRQRGTYGNYTGSGTYRVVLEYEGGKVRTEFKICKATKLR